MFPKLTTLALPGEDRCAPYLADGYGAASHFRNLQPGTWSLSDSICHNLGANSDSMLDGIDLALASRGAKVLLATCHDELHPAENVLVPDNNYWSTTGASFPHHLVVKLPEKVSVQNIEVISLGVKTMAIFTATHDPSDFEEVDKVTLDLTSRLQYSTVTSARSAQYVKVTIDEAYGPFTAIKRLAVKSQ